MQEATFLILTALADGSQHGYGIIAEVQEISGGRVRLRAGTLYTALDRLRADGLIGVDREEIVEGRLRRYYRLTPEGTRRLAAEAARLQANARAALTRLNPFGGGHTASADAGRANPEDTAGDAAAPAHASWRLEWTGTGTRPGRLAVTAGRSTR
jgi:DNA-binding PadR family transcriptional regulator